ncbi:hypothetical protein [Amycolatopsis eburnea]|uniref:Uncharacterized protein n=1 Tax=Amycolatopsis eburnea TaxID=2267691 RepID=A0A427T3R9_9PSEU|nr:hypothetical protein [Amycolatopsis eburnea]RSD13588.1 hypothetical protein EIY87_28180 [Amycolatopsis eburnea]
MSRRKGAPRRMFGPIDPYCLLAVLPMLLVAGMVAALVSVPVGLVVAVFAGLIVVFDSWANRPGPVAPVRHPRPQPRPVVVRRPRPPAARPTGYRPRPGVWQPAPGAPYRR